MDIEVFKSILNIPVEIFSRIRDPEYRKIIFLEISQKIKEVKWKGISFLIERVFDQLIAEEESAIIIACGIRFISKINPDKAKKYANELLLRVDELSPFHWDRAIALIYSADALINIDKDLAEKLTEKALEEAELIPDRSDRSDAYAKLIPLLYKLGKRDIIYEIYKKIVYYPRKVEAVASLIKVSYDRELLKELLADLDEKDKLLIVSYIARYLSKKNVEVARKMIDRVIGKIQSIHIPDFERSQILANIIYIYSVIDKSKSEKFLREFKEILMRHISEPHFVALALEIPIMLLELKHDDYAKEIFEQLVDEIMKVAKEELFVLSNVAYCYSQFGDFEKAYEYLSKAYSIAQKEKFIAALIDVCSISFAIINEFPEEVPVELAQEFADRIIGIKRITLEKVKLTEENYQFLKTMFEDNIQEGINKAVNLARWISLEHVEEKAINAVYEIMKQDPTILHYILKYVMSLPIPEGERKVLFQLIEKAVENSSNFERAKQFLDILIGRLSRFNIPIFPALIRYVSEYLPYVLFQGREIEVE